MAIHPTALIHPDARIHETAEVGPFVVVEDDVEIGEQTRIAAQAVLKSGLRLGARVRVHEGAVLGGVPQDKKFDPDTPSFAVVEDDCILREFSTVHRSSHEGGVTRVRQGCFLMGYGHVAHDCDVGEGAIIASYAAIAGHIEIGSGAFISGGVAIHQFSHIGALSMIGGNSKVNLDVPPFFTVDGVPAGAVGLNVVGLRRAGLDNGEISALKQAYRLLYRSKLPLAQATSEIASLGTSSTDELAAFLRKSKRGICRQRARR